MTDSLASMAGRNVSKGTKGWIRNMALYNGVSTEYDDTLELMFRPSQIKEALSVRYQDQGVIGMSHQYQTYAFTDSPTITFEIFENALMYLKAGEIWGTESAKPIAEKMEKDRRFLQALTVPPWGIDGIIGTEPPACILCVPGICTLRVRVQSINTTYTKCDIDGNIQEFRAAIVFKEAPMGRYAMQDVLKNGMFRTWGL